MRILHVTPYIPPHLGGLEALVESLAARQTERGHEVCVVASSAGLDDGWVEPAERRHRTVYVPALNRPLEDGLGVPYPLFGPRLVSTLRREMRNVDVIHLHGFLFMSTVFGHAVARRVAPRTPVVLTEHAGHAPYDRRVFDMAQTGAISTIGRFNVRRADALVVYNRSARDAVTRVAGGRPLEWIDNGIDFERFHPATAQQRAATRREFGWDDAPRVLFAGRPVPKKGLDVALGATSIADGAFTLVMVGDDERTGGEHLESLGRVPPERMPDLYRAADALIAPSRGEGPTLVMLEALACGLPMVVTDDPVIRERLGAAGDAVRFEPPEAPAMAAALGELLAEPAAESSEAAADFARRNFSVPAWVDAHEELYARLLQGDPR